MKFRVYYYNREHEELCTDIVEAQNREEASSIGEMLYGDEFRVALKVIRKGPRKKPKIRIS